MDRLRKGGADALAALFSEYRPRLETLVEFRLDHRLRGRVDSSDILQDAFIEVSRRIDRYLDNPDVSFFVWVRKITHQVLVDVQRRHFRGKRSAKNEVSWLSRANPNDTSFSIIQAVLARLSSPSEQAIRNEEYEQLQQALLNMDATDREVLALRHFEQLGNNETAEVLGLSVTAASNRYIRALRRLSRIIAKLSKGR